MDASLFIPGSPSRSLPPGWGRSTPSTATPGACSAPSTPARPSPSSTRPGRMVIAAKLLEEFGIGREVTVAGVFDHLEIWDRAAWRAQRNAEGSAEDVAERLANRD